MSKFVLTLDASQLKEYQTCPLAWYYRYKQNLELKDLKTTALDMGTAVHELLDKYYIYKAGGFPIDHAAGNAIQLWRTAKTCENLGFDLATESFIEGRFSDYIKRYYFDDLNVAINNDVPAVELGFTKVLQESEDFLFAVEGRIDLITSFQGFPCWVDHKTQDRISYLYHFKPQFLTYSWATGYEYGMINYFCLHKEYQPGKTFRREIINYPKWMILDWELKMKKIFWDIMIGLKSEDPEKYFMRRKIESSCAGAFETHPCMFTNLCETEFGPARNIIKGAKYNKKEPWTPWKLKT